MAITVIHPAAPPSANTVDANLGGAGICLINGTLQAADSFHINPVVYLYNYDPDPAMGSMPPFPSQVQCNEIPTTKVDPNDPNNLNYTWSVSQFHGGDVPGTTGPASQANNKLFILVRWEIPGMMAGMGDYVYEPNDGSTPPNPVPMEWPYHGSQGSCNAPASRKHPHATAVAPTNVVVPVQEGRWLIYCDLPADLTNPGLHLMDLDGTTPLSASRIAIYAFDVDC